MSVTLIEAVALSLDVDPLKLKKSNRLHNAGKYLEGAEFDARLSELARFCSSFHTIEHGLFERIPTRFNLGEFSLWTKAAEWLVPEQLRQIAETYNHDLHNEPADMFDGSGYPGRPSKASGVIEAEFLRRWEAGERYPDKRNSESPALWAKILLTWYEKAYPEQLKPTLKTLKNKMSPQLRVRQSMGPK